MKKKILLVSALVALTVVFAFAVPQPTTEKFEVKDRPNAHIYVTKIYESEFWAEFYMIYEEKTDSFDEKVTEKIMYEFISRYKVDHKFSRVEVEDLEAANIDEDFTRVRKRVIFRQNRK
ncbi:MAG: hypothetical protein CR988_00495 [Treponema sp.]|nr:MAG: hypothetical protein CR988_00495 [Treponema sp.]